VRLSIIIPVFNEILTIQAIIRAIRESPLDKELIVVDDASTDGTRRVLERLKGPDMKLIFHAENKGKGAAIRSAVPHVTGDVVVIQDADLEYSPSQFPSLLTHIERNEADVVYGSRFRGDHRSFIFSHFIGNQLLTWFTNLLYNSCLTDMETCYKMMRASIFRELDLQANRFDIEPEITAKILRRGHRLLEVPIDYVGRGYSEGKKIKWTDGLGAVWALLKWRLLAKGPDCPLEKLLGGLFEHHRWVSSWILPHLGQRVVHFSGLSGELDRFLLDRDALWVSDPDPANLAALGRKFRYVDHVKVEALHLDHPQLTQQMAEFAPDTFLVTELMVRVPDERELLRRLVAVAPGPLRLVLIGPSGNDCLPLDTELGRIRRCSATTLTRLVEELGFTVQTTETHNALGGLGWRLVGWIPTSIRPLGLSSWGYRKLLPLVRWLDDAGLSSFGNSVVLVARRD